MNTARRLFTIIAAALTALLVSSCVVPAATPQERTPAKWGPSRMHHHNISYGPDPAHTADLYLPTIGGNRGVIILVHGGGFTGGHRNDVRDTSGIIMHQTHRGFAVLNISYRTAAGNTNVFPAAVDDLNTAVRWARSRQGRAAGINPATVIVAGNSAGGTIASLVGVGSNSDPSGPLGRTERVDGWVSFAGLMDLRDNQAHPGVITTAQNFGRDWVGTVGGLSARLAAASPITHLDPTDPPGYIVHGAHDTIVHISQMNNMVARAGQLGISGRLYYDTVTSPHIDTTTGQRIPCSWHIPQCGTNTRIFDYWIDRVTERAL